MRKLLKTPRKARITKHRIGAEIRPSVCRHIRCVLGSIRVTAPEHDAIDGGLEVRFAQVRVTSCHPAVLVPEQSLQTARLDAGHRLIAREYMKAIVKPEILDASMATADYSELYRPGAWDLGGRTDLRRRPPLRLTRQPLWFSPSGRAVYKLIT
jgi:hypothetical protein